MRRYTSEDVVKQIAENGGRYSDDDEEEAVKIVMFQERYQMPQDSHPMSGQQYKKGDLRERTVFVVLYEGDDLKEFDKELPEGHPNKDKRMNPTLYWRRKRKR